MSDEKLLVWSASSNSHSNRVNGQSKNNQPTYGTRACKLYLVRRAQHLAAQDGENKSDTSTETKRMLTMVVGPTFPTEPLVDRFQVTI